MSSHTPGPWEWRSTKESDSGGDEYMPSKSRLGRATNLPERVLMADHMLRADAALIAAAPELVAMLEALQWGDQSDDDDPGCPECGDWVEIGHHRDCTLAALIARARGEGS